MKVCFISFEYPPNIIGGAGTYAETLVKGLRRRGVDTFIISSGDQHSEIEKTFRVPTSNSMYWRRLFFAGSALSLFRKLHDLWKFDLVHFNEPHILVDKPKLPTVCTLHSTQVNELMQKLACATTLKTTVGIRDFILKGLNREHFRYLHGACHRQDNLPVSQSCGSDKILLFCG